MRVQVTMGSAHLRVLHELHTAGNRKFQKRIHRGCCTLEPSTYIVGSNSAFLYLLHT